MHHLRKTVFGITLMSLKNTCSSLLQSVLLILQPIIVAVKTIKQLRCQILLLGVAPACIRPTLV